MALTVFILFSLFALSQAQLHRVTLTDPEALCLDGSHGIYYMGKGTDPKTVVIYF